jgi:hypothetical protein
MVKKKEGGGGGLCTEFMGQSRTLHILFVDCMFKESSFCMKKYDRFFVHYNSACNN